jgi:hypothetical protein
MGRAPAIRSHGVDAGSFWGCRGELRIDLRSTRRGFRAVRYPIARGLSPVSCNRTINHRFGRPEGAKGGYIAHWYRFRLMIRPDFRFGSGGWPIPIWRQIRMEFRLVSCRLDSVSNIRQAKSRPNYAGAAPHNASAAALSGFRLFVSPATVPPGSDRLGTIDLPISTLS